MDKYIIIPTGEELPFQKVILDWHTGIDAIEIKDGTFVIDEKVYNLLKEKYCDRTVSIKDKEETIESFLSKCSIIDEKNIIFKTEESIKI